MRAVSDPMARQMAALVLGSDLDELVEIVRRWIETAPDARARALYDAFGGRMLDLKRALADAPVQPTQAELELALDMMLKLAAQSGGGAPPRFP